MDGLDGVCWPAAPATPVGRTTKRTAAAARTAPVLVPRVA